MKCQLLTSWDSNKQLLGIGQDTLVRTTAVSPEPYTTDSEGTGVRYSACLSAL